MTVRSRGFSLLELLTAVSVLAVMMIIILEMVEATQSAWSSARGRIEQFREAQVAFETVSRRLSQATLNTYLSFNTKRRTDNVAQVPTDYVRQSNNHFISGPAEELIGSDQQRKRPTHAVFFQAPFGFTGLGGSFSMGGSMRELDGVVNCWGYYIEYNSDEPFRPTFLNSLPNAPEERMRFRLMEFRPPSENSLIYHRTLSGKPPIWQMATGNAEDYRFWFAPREASLEQYGVNSPFNYQPLTGGGGEIRPCRVVAENIIALIIRPTPGRFDDSSLGTQTSAMGRNQQVLREGESYYYDTREWQWRTLGNPQSVKSLNDVVQNSMNMLPPLLEVTMVAIDEPSARRWELLHGGPGKAQAPDFTDGLFVVPDQYADDIEELEERLIDAKVDYRVFRTTVHLKESRWSETFPDNRTN